MIEGTQPRENTKPSRENPATVTAASTSAFAFLKTLREYAEAVANQPLHLVATAHDSTMAQSLVPEFSSSKTASVLEAGSQSAGRGGAGAPYAQQEVAAVSPTVYVGTG